MDVYQNLKDAGIILPPAPPLGGVYTPAREFGTNLCYVSGAGPNVEGKPQWAGKLGSTYTLEQGQEAARDAIKNALSVLHNNLGDLNKIKKFVKILAFVASADDFFRQPEVANGASQLLVDIFGEEIGRAARSAIGVNVLPGNIPFEIEFLVELTD